MTVSTVTAPPVPGCLVMTAEPSACTSAIGKPGRCPPSGSSVKKREVAAGGLRAALEDVPGDGRAGQRVEVVAAPAEVGDRRPDDERGVGDPAGDHDVRAGARQSAMPNAPR